MPIRFKIFPLRIVEQFSYFNTSIIWNYSFLSGCHAAKCGFSFLSGQHILEGIIMLSKNIVFFFLFFIAVFTTGFAQSVQVIEKVEVTSIENGEFYYPRFNNSGDKIVFTSEAYKGLWLHDTRMNSTSLLSMQDGIGYNPRFDREGENIIVRSYKFENMKRISGLLSINLKSGTATELLANQRDLNYPVVASNKNIYSIVDKKVIGFDEALQKQNPLTDESIVFIDNSNLVIETNGERKVINPLGDGNYLWPSFSSDGQKILFSKAGEGAFICDLEGNIIVELGRAHSPKWAKDDQWIVYMDDYDDGVQFISSEIKIKHVASGAEFDLTRTDNVIEMYPDYSKVTDEVVYHTTEGKIIKLTLQFN